MGPLGGEAGRHVWDSGRAMGNDRQLHREWPGAGRQEPSWLNAPLSVSGIGSFGQVPGAPTADTLCTTSIHRFLLSLLARLTDANYSYQEKQEQKTPFCSMIECH